MYKKRLEAVVLCLVLCLSMLSGCGQANVEESGTEQTEIQVFVAASLSAVVSELAGQFMQQHPEVKITINSDSSGVLLQQIENGFECDLFFSAAEKQMDQLEADGFLKPDSRIDVLNNQVCLVTYKGSGTKVTGFENIDQADSIALADASVPVGKYTRQALVNLGVLTGDDPAAITTEEVSQALGGVEISEQGNVSKVRTAVIEGSCEVGTVYLSDTYGFSKDLDILQIVDYDLTGDVIYPMALISNPEADDRQTEAAKSFYDYILSDEAKAIFETYLFDTNVTR